MQEPPPEKYANEQEVSLQSILNAIQSHSEQTSAAIKQINEGMDRLSEKVDYVHQEQIEMESSQDVIRRAGSLVNLLLSFLARVFEIIIL